MNMKNSKPGRPWMEKGKLYMLRGLAKNKFDNTMIVDSWGHLRTAWAPAQPIYTDGALFMCLHCKPIVSTPSQVAQYGQFWQSELLTPDGRVVKINSNGNKVKFKLVR